MTGDHCGHAAPCACLNAPEQVDFEAGLRRHLAEQIQALPRCRPVNWHAWDAVDVAAVLRIIDAPSEPASGLERGGDAPTELGPP